MALHQPFDALAAGYDEDFTNTATGRYLRGRVQARLAQHFRAGHAVLELGCGTGEDALWLAGRGVFVLATDASTAMLDITRAKAGGSGLVQVERLDLQHLPVRGFDFPLSGENPRGQRPARLFDGAFASFGPLNCLTDWQPLSRWLAQRVRAGGTAAFGVMSPLCVWEMAWHGAHGDLRTAFRRWRRQTEFHPVSPTPRSSRAPEVAQRMEAAVIVRYPTIRRLTRDFAPDFRRVHVEPLGLFLPPSDVFGVVEKRPRLFNRLLRLEERFGKSSRLALLADHYWIEFERTGH